MDTSRGDLIVRPVQGDSDLTAMIAVRARVDPRPPQRLENLRHNLASSPGLSYIVAFEGDEPVGYGLVEIELSPHAHAHVAVVPEARGRGCGSALLAEVSARAHAHGKTALQGYVVEGEEEAIRYLRRRGYEIVGGEKGVALDLAAASPVAVELPAGIRVVSRAERPDVVEGMYEVSLEAEEDIPGSMPRRSFDVWRAYEIERPSLRPELCFVALAGDGVVGWASLDDAGSTAYHRLTAVKRAWRRRGIATALKQAQIRAAKNAGFERLVTGSEERNLPMRRLNEKLGYRPEPSVSVVIVRGPLVQAPATYD